MSLMFGMGCHVMATMEAELKNELFFEKIRELKIIYLRA